MRIEGHAPPGSAASDRLQLTFEERTRPRLPVQLESGEQAALALARGATLRHGDLLIAGDGRVIEVVAAIEPLIQVRTTDAALLARAAYHLGNRHVAVEVRADALRVARDRVIERMLRGLGLEPEDVEASFEPETGAYGAGHAHVGAAAHPAPVIHEYLLR